MDDEYDLRSITYEPRNRPGWGATGATGPAEPSKGATMAYWVGRCYGPYETQKDAEEASERLIILRAAEHDAEGNARSLAKDAAKKLSEEEYQAIYDIGFYEGRGYW